MPLTLGIFLGAITLVMVRPKPFNEATAAALGAAAMLIFSIISPVQAWEVLQANANILLFFLGLMIISVVAEQAGFFNWCALRAMKTARGRGPVLLAIIFGLGALIFYSVLYQSNLIPRWLSVLGLIGYTMLSIGVLLDLFGYFYMNTDAGMLLYTPGGLFELFLPIWLFIKGFNSSTIASVSAKAGS